MDPAKRPRMSAPPKKIVQSALPAKERHETGWRRHRPLEDPEKTKRWGFITAKPSEFLIHVRRGRIVDRTTGQGASCFKWPSDSVAIVPTTINRLQFTADQVTREKIGVEVSGLAVYRIVDPLVAYRMLNFSYAERAGEKLDEILAEMFVGATRRLVANLAVEEALTRRKETLATELMREIAPIVEGRGRADDHTDKGWGVVIDTIEIQSVKVLSERVFEQMQAVYRAELTRRSREAEIEGEAATRALSAIKDAELAALAERATMEAIERRMRELAAERALIEREHEQARLRLQAELEERARRAQAEQDEGRSELALLAERKTIEQRISEEQLRLVMIERALPEIARAIGAGLGDVRITSIGRDVDPGMMVASAIAELSRLVESVRSASTSRE